MELYSICPSMADLLHLAQPQVLFILFHMVGSPHFFFFQMSEPSPGCKSHSSGKRTARGDPTPFLSLRLQPCLGPPSDPRLTEPNSSRRQWTPPEKHRADCGLRRGTGAGRADHRRFPGEVSEPAADIFCLLQTGWWMAVGRGFSAR